MVQRCFHRTLFPLTVLGLNPLSQQAACSAEVPLTSSRTSHRRSDADSPRFPAPEAQNTPGFFLISALLDSHRRYRIQTRGVSASVPWCVTEKAFEWFSVEQRPLVLQTRWVPLRIDLVPQRGEPLCLCLTLLQPVFDAPHDTHTHDTHTPSHAAESCVCVCGLELVRLVGTPGGAAEGQRVTDCPLWLCVVSSWRTSVSSWLTVPEVKASSEPLP